MRQIAPRPDITGALPKQDQDLIMRVADRWDRSSVSHNEWAKIAKQCVDFVEGRQWTADQLADLELQKRPALVFNKIAPLVRLIVGYHRNNRTDIKYFPSGEGVANDDVAEVLTRIEKQVHEQNSMAYVDAEVFLDGIIAGRGYWDDRVNQEVNVLGLIESGATDPFTVYLDPDADSYDLDKTSTSVQTTRWVSADEIEMGFGKIAKEALNPFFSNNSWTMFPNLATTAEDEITPLRTFGLKDDITMPGHERFATLFNEQFLDPYRKNIRLLDTQHYRTVPANVFVDLETGETQPIPDDWRRDRIEKVLFHAEQIGNPMVVTRRKVRKLRWTIIVGDILVYDAWSPYKTFSIRPFFPYFRRGMTRGMVEDLKDPQLEVNKRRMAEIEIVGRTSHSGHMYEKGALDTTQKTNLEMFGAVPGFNLEVEDGKIDKVKKIDPSPPPTAMERLEDKSNANIKEIGGVNDSALGELDKVQSGKAIRARQQQAVIGFQMYMDNFSRSKELQGRKHLELIQQFYTEERIFRVLGEDGVRTAIFINRNVAGRILNDITVGAYGVSIDETPMSASFESAQFEEALLILEKLGPIGQAVMQARPDLLIQMSSLPRKDEWAEGLRQALEGAAEAGPDGQPVAAPSPGGNVVPLAQGRTP